MTRAATRDAGVREAAGVGPAVVGAAGTGMDGTDTDGTGTTGRTASVAGTTAARGREEVTVTGAMPHTARTGGRVAGGAAGGGDAGAGRTAEAVRTAGEARRTTAAAGRLAVATGPRAAGGSVRRGAARGGARAAVASAAVLLALAALQGRAAADATTAPAGPAVWQPQGAPLAGAATTADAPQMKAAVTYRDALKVDETRFYGIALDAASSAAVSVFAVPPPGTRVAYGDGIELTLQNADGDECDSAEVHFGDDGDPRPLGTAVARLITGDDSDSCQSADQYTLEVHRTSDATSDPGPWPLELRYVSEPGLVPGDGAPSADTSGSADAGGTAASGGPGDSGSSGDSGGSPTGTASPTPLLTGTPRQASGGPSFETAAALRTGIWKDRVLPGETRFYKVPVDWGQQATVFTDFSSAQVTDDSAYVAEGVRVTEYSPVRELVHGDDRSYEGKPVSIGEQLAPVAYANRASDDDEVATVRYAGWYYVAVTVHPGVAKAVQGAVPVTLRVQVSGAARPAPDYAGDPSAAGIGVSSHDVAAADGTAGGGGSGHGALRFLAFAMFGAAAVLLLTLGGWYVVARRRAPAAADTVTAPRPQGYGPPRW